jgi:hypothetical protein
MLNDAYASAQAAVAESGRLAGLVDERKRALITACVTGELDISSATDRAALLAQPSRNPGQPKGTSIQ